MLLVFTFLLAVLLQLTLLPFLGSWFFQADIVLACIIIWSILRGGREVLLLGFIAGLLLSHFSLLHFGFLPLFYVLIAYLSSLITVDMLQGHWVVVGALALMMTALFEILVGLSLAFAGYPLDLSRYAMHVMLPRIFWSTLLSSGGYLFFRNLYPWYFSKRPEVKA